MTDTASNWSRRWALLRQSIVTAFPSAVDDGPAAMRLVLVATTGGRPVGLRIRATTAYGEPVLVLATDLDATMVLDASQALVVNGVLAYGALAVVDHTLELRAIHDMNIEPARLNVSIRKLAAETAELLLRAPRTTIAARAAAVSYFAD